MAKILRMLALVLILISFAWRSQAHGLHGAGADAGVPHVLLHFAPLLALSGALWLALTLRRLPRGFPRSSATIACVLLLLLALAGAPGLLS